MSIFWRPIFFCLPPERSADNAHASAGCCWAARWPHFPRSSCLCPNSPTVFNWPINLASALVITRRHLRLAQQTKVTDCLLLVRSVEYCVGRGGPPGHSAHRHPSFADREPDGVSTVSPLLLVGLSALCCLAVELGLRLLNKPKPTNQIVGLELELAGTILHLRAALDTVVISSTPSPACRFWWSVFPDAQNRLPQILRDYLTAWFAGKPPGDPPPHTRLRLIPCRTASQHSLLPGFAVGNIGLITTNGILGLGRTAVAFAPQSFGSEHYEALYGNDFL